MEHGVQQLGGCRSRCSGWDRGWRRRGHLTRL